jgi:hypothetical protein
MKPIVTFVLGALVAGAGVYFFAARKPETPQPGTPQKVAADGPQAAPVLQAPPPVDVSPAPAQAIGDPIPQTSVPAIASGGFKKAPAATASRREVARTGRSSAPIVASSTTSAPATAPADNPGPAIPPPVAGVQSQMPGNEATAAAAPPSSLEPPVVHHEPPPPPKPHSVTISGGTQVTVRLAEMVSSDKNQAGDPVSATLDQPIIIDGFVIAERGSRVNLKVTDSEKAGRVKGVSQIGLELVSLRTSDGQQISVRSDPFEKEGPSSKKADAAKVGAGAALGAIIGAIAGGGKGAAIGTAAGAGAGGGAVLTTRGKPAVLPVETRLTFRLREPVTITERLK